MSFVSPASLFLFYLGRFCSCFNAGFLLFWIAFGLEVQTHLASGLLKSKCQM